MRKQLLESAALDVAHQVRAVEDNLDSTLEELAILQTAMLRARRVANVSVVTGQSALASLADTMQTLVAARASIGKCHIELKTSKQDVPGLRMSNIGDEDDSPPIKPNGIADGELKIVV